MDLISWKKKEKKAGKCPIGSLLPPSLYLYIYIPYPMRWRKVVSKFQWHWKGFSYLSSRPFFSFPRQNKTSFPLRCRGRRLEREMVSIQRLRGFLALFPKVICSLRWELGPLVVWPIVGFCKFVLVVGLGTSLWHRPSSV